MPWARVIRGTNSKARAVVPWAAESAFEVWIVPRRHQAEFGEATPEEVTRRATGLINALAEQRGAMKAEDLRTKSVDELTSEGFTTFRTPGASARPSGRSGSRTDDSAFTTRIGPCGSDSRSASRSTSPPSPMTIINRSAYPLGRRTGPSGSTSRPNASVVWAAATVRRAGIVAIFTAASSRGMVRSVAVARTWHDRAVDPTERRRTDMRPRAVRSPLGVIRTWGSRRCSKSAPVPAMRQR